MKMKIICPVLCFSLAYMLYSVCNLCKCVLNVCSVVLAFLSLRLLESKQIYN